MKYLSRMELQRAYASGDILSVALVADGKMFEVRMTTTDGAAKLSENGAPKTFADPAEALLLLGKLGIVNLNVETEGWHPDLRSQNYGAWKTAKVEAALAGLGDGSNRVFSADEWALIRAAKKSRRGI